ncbi:MAG TPA: hypothetical protein VM010_03605 [Chitinophagaceae bacterium]|nr:hypothetical protein [Chitinophagaceae bacterium]
MRYLFLALLITATFSKPHAQGCVAIRSNGGTCTMSDPSHGSHSGWVLGLNARYFKSFRHFSATEEQKQRLEQHTEVINHTTVLDLGLTRTINSRWSLAFYVPLMNNARSSLYEHDRKNRYSTHSFGLGDARFAAYRWLLDPAVHMKKNVQLGLGIKLPTGDYRYQDYFHISDTTPLRLGPVDQSIQLGDGGTGLTLELNTFYHIAPNISLYGNGYYLMNPREQNGVSTTRGGIASDTTKLYTTDVMSVPDQYMVRAGVSYAVNGLTLSVGGRMECVPVHDLIGGNKGFRRPGYVLSVEPVVAYKMKRAQVYLSVPYAVERARTQSVPDKIRSGLTKTSYTGDAAFADYSINAGVAFRL